MTNDFVWKRSFEKSPMSWLIIPKIDIVERRDIILEIIHRIDEQIAQLRIFPNPTTRINYLQKYLYI